MTDADLMDAECIHGNTWWECPTCGEEVAALLAWHEAKESTTEYEG
jgi:hypothetical protein